MQSKGQDNLGGLREYLRTIGIDLPERVDVKTLDEIILPLLEGKKGDKVGQEVFTQMFTALVVEEMNKGASLRKAYRRIKARIEKGRGFIVPDSLGAGG